MIVVDKKGKRLKNNWQWFIYALGAFFCWGFLALFSKYILSQGINVFVYLFYLSLFVGIFISAEIKLKKRKFLIKNSNYKLLFLIGFFGALFNLFGQFGYLYSPNPGYINAVNASSISLLTLLSAYFFKDELNLRKVIGVAGVTVGLIILLV